LGNNPGPNNKIKSNEHPTKSGDEVLQDPNQILHVLYSRNKWILPVRGGRGFAGVFLFRFAPKKLSLQLSFNPQQKTDLAAFLFHIELHPVL
jgi:hypothetical protein